MNKKAEFDAGKNPGKKNPSEAVRPADKPKMLACACAALCALTVGTAVWAGVNVSGATGEVAQFKAATRPTVVATAAIPSGTVIGIEDVRLADVPETYLAEDAAADPASVIGKTATANIPANAQVAQSNLAGAGNVTALAEAVEPGYVAASIAVNSETGVAGLVHQGDYVDVLAEGGTVIEGARVLALDAQLAGEITQYSTVTIEVTVEQAADVQAAQMDSAVRLVLNSRVAEAV